MSMDHLTRRRTLQAAGTAVIAAGLSGLTANTATAGERTGHREPELIIYPRPSAMPTNTSFKVRVRLTDGEWQTLDIWRPRLEEINATTGSGKVYNSSLVTFDFRGSVEVEITYLPGGTTKARVRPDSYRITPELLGDTLRFTLDEPRDLVVQINDGVFDCLHLFTNRIETHPPSADDPDVLYFGPGVHTTSDGYVHVRSGQTVHVAGGAVLNATVLFQGVEKARLTGHGFINSGTSGGCYVENSKNIRIENVTMLNPNGYATQLGNSKNVHIRGLRAFSAKGWGDGIDVFCSEDVLIDRVFMRNSDDCIAIYGHRWEYYGDCRDITVQNSTLWADVAHPINIGTHGNTDSPEVIENLLFKNLDICDHREPQMNYQGCIAINPGDSNLVRGVRLEDIRVEDFRWGQLIHMRVAYNKSYNTSVGRGIEDVYIKNLTYTGTHSNSCLFLGYDAEHGITDITFENLVINGTVIADSMKKPSWYKTTDVVQWHANEHVTNLRFITTEQAEAEAAATS